MDCVLVEDTADCTDPACTCKPEQKAFPKMSPRGRTHDLGEDEPPQPPNQKADA